MFKYIIYYMNVKYASNIKGEWWISRLVTVIGVSF